MAGKSKKKIKLINYYNIEDFILPENEEEPIIEVIKENFDSQLYSKILQSIYNKYYE